MGEEKIQTISDMAFDGIDEDYSETITQDELQAYLITVSNKMGIQTPTENDLNSILSVMDYDNDGVVNKEEFALLVTNVLKNMYHGELGLASEVKDQIREAPHSLPLETFNDQIPSSSMNLN